MDRDRFSYIAHSDMRICNPLSTAKLDLALSFLDLNPDDRALDIGAGKGELLLRIWEQYRVRGVGVDRSPLMTRAFEAEAALRAAPGSVEILTRRAREYLETDESRYRLVCCVGSTQAFDDYTDAIETLTKVVEPGGYLIIGELYWRKQPDSAYLKWLGSEDGHVVTHFDNIRIAENRDLSPVCAFTANQDEWDAYEWHYSAAMTRFLAENPNDRDNRDFADRIRWWREGYLRWGRDTMGFGLYVFRVPS